MGALSRWRSEGLQPTAAEPSRTRRAPVRAAPAPCTWQVQRKEGIAELTTLQIWLELARGELPHDALVRGDEVPEWTRASEVPELACVVASVADRSACDVDTTIHPASLGACAAPVEGLSRDPQEPVACQTHGARRPSAGPSAWSFVRSFLTPITATSAVLSAVTVLGLVSLLGPSAYRQPASTREAVPAVTAERDAAFESLAQGPSPEEAQERWVQMLPPSSHRGQHRSRAGSTHSAP